MNNETILKKAIEKAESNDFQNPNVLATYSGQGIMYKNYYSVIFSHDFAKAFWGKKETDLVGEGGATILYYGTQPAWQYHLQQMVLEEDPIAYLEQYL